MAQDLGKIFRKSSEVPRAQESTKNIQEGLYEALDVNKKKPIRIDMCLGFSGEAIKKLDTERENLAKQGKSDDEILDLWLSEKLVVSPYSVAKTLFHLVVSILQRVEKYSQPFIIYSNRHGEKNVQGGLTKRGVEQTKQLGKNIAQKRDKKVDTLILTTHMSINEGLLSLLFPYAGFPPKWKG
ncbi:MAG: hypothetical protein LBD11_00065 [Candidatus Peribacteria bacterium]|jgi:hypothetical protein|nr:hypothetical protein [Candidatus Peribacteria bacterium]